MFFVVWKDLNWSQIKETFWNLFLQIKKIPANVLGADEIDLTDDIQLLILANLSYWITTFIIIVLMLLLFYLVRSYFR